MGAASSGPLPGPADLLDNGDENLQRLTERPGASPERL